VEVLLAVFGVTVLVVLIMVVSVACASKARSESDGGMERDEINGFGDLPGGHPYGSGVRSGPIQGERTADEVTEAVEAWRDQWSDFRMC